MEVASLGEWPVYPHNFSNTAHKPNQTSLSKLMRRTGIKWRPVSHSDTNNEASSQDRQVLCAADGKFPVRDPSWLRTTVLCKPLLLLLGQLYQKAENPALVLQSVDAISISWERSQQTWLQFLPPTGGLSSWTPFSLAQLILTFLWRHFFCLELLKRIVMFHFPNFLNFLNMLGKTPQNL